MRRKFKLLRNELQNYSTTDTSGTTCATVTVILICTPRNLSSIKVWSGNIYQTSQIFANLGILYLKIWHYHTLLRSRMQNLCCHALVNHFLFSYQGQIQDFSLGGCQPSLEGVPISDTGAFW